MLRRALVWLLPAFFALAFAQLTDFSKVVGAIAATAYAAPPATIERGALRGIAAISDAPDRDDNGRANWSRLTGEDDDPDQFCLANRISADIQGMSYVPRDRTSEFVGRSYSNFVAYARGPPSV